MKYSAGLSKLLPSLAILICYLASVLFLTLSIKVVEISKAYAIWSGVGIFCIFLVGTLFFNETFSYSKIFFSALIIAGVAGLQLSS